MADYIRRDALRETRNLAIRAYENANVFNADAIRKRLKPLLDAIVELPAADVAPVVRCKDCKYGDYDSKSNGAMVCLRTNDGFWRKETDFCSYGEWREE